MILEREAIALVCRNPQSDLSEIIQVFEQTAADIAAEDYRDYSNYNQAFHMAIWSAAENEKLKLILSTLWNGLSIGDSVSEEVYAQKSFNEHKMIIESLKARDTELAQHLMEAHILRSRDDILTHFE